MAQEAADVAIEEVADAKDVESAQAELDALDLNTATQEDIDAAEEAW